MRRDVRRKALLLALGACLVSFAEAADWVSKWVEECSSWCGSGLRTLEVSCRSSPGEYAGNGWKQASEFDWVTLSDSACDGSSRPAGQEACHVECYYVDPTNGSDANNGTEGAPLHRVARCVELSAGSEDVTRCILRSGVYSETNITLEGVSRLVVEPAAGETAVFDGTAPLSGLNWTASTARAEILVAEALAIPRRAALVVDGAALQCAADYDRDNLGDEPCFAFNPRAEDGAGWAAVFSRVNATSFFLNGTLATKPNCSFWWEKEGGGTLYVDTTGRSEGYLPEVTFPPPS
ncbi:hypothetical protein CYMTET_23790 [Cymbomonas tetramitiformis]|uniref:DUF1565 domain-containing protein n=1 Tax=Cymbomonas tetramitiformis TaxID=36881 RepID=A0AAE0FXH6_9CHLO|nr:hypothetical protein CYMTET_23790 [Cymbomonas tetramitiformis]